MKFNPGNIGFAVALGDEVHTPERTPQLSQMVDQYGEIFVDSFLSIQIVENFKALALNCYDIERAAQNICIALKSEKKGYSLMLGEWLLVFHKMNNCEDVRKDYNQANYVKCLKASVDAVCQERRKKQDSIERETEEKRIEELYELYKTGQITFDEYFNRRDGILFYKQ